MVLLATQLAAAAEAPRPVEDSVTSIQPQGETQAPHVDAVRPSENAPWKLALHAGWWDAGVDVTVPNGIFFGVGVPWPPLTPLFGYSGREGVVALDSRLGYGYAVSRRTTLYGEVLGAWTYDWGHPCGGGCTTRSHKVFLFPVVGLRHQFDSGVIVGADLSLLVVSLRRENEPPNEGWRLKRLLPWVGPAFSQVYVGYEWTL